MVLRCYSRRHVVPAFRAARRQLTTGLPLSAAHTNIPSDQSKATSAGALSQSRRVGRAGHQHESWSFFFPDHLSWTKRPSAPRASHPLVKKLISEIYSTDREPSANRAWKAYTDLKEASGAHAVGQSSESFTALLTQLEPAHLQQLLRAIDPAVATSRKLARAEGKHFQSLQQKQQVLTSGLAPTKILVEPQTSRKSAKTFDAQHPVREYMRRVHIIFRDMRLHSSVVPTTSSATDSLPSLDDYNHVLARLATGGHIGPMSAIWNELSGVTLKSGTKGLHPNRHTYRELMIGLSRHATEQIERVQKNEASKTFDYSGKKRQLEKSARAAAAGMAKFGQILAPSARAAAILAALRTMALLKDMKDHGVTPNQITLDFAARTLRLAGHTDGLHMLMHDAYGIDLASADTADTSSTELAPTTHTLNTILMALGEQASVPEMVAAFETLAKPLPVASTGTDATSSGEGLFSTKWKDIFSSMRNRESEADQPGNVQDEADIPDVFPYTFPHRIQPNTKTFQILLRHCCAEVDPLRSPVALKNEAGGSVAALAMESTQLALAEMQDGGPRAAEMERRTKGAYSLFARSLLSEAVGRSEELLHSTARSLGIDLQQRDVLAEAAAKEVESSGDRDVAEATQLRPEYQRVSVIPGRAMDTDFHPIYEAPSFSVTALMVEPFFSLASARRNIGDLRWVRGMLSKALEIKIAETQVIDAAWRVYRSRFSKTRQNTSAAPASAGEHASAESDSSASLQSNGQGRAEVSAFLQRLRQQHRIAAKHAQSLEQLLYDRLDERLHDLSARRDAKQQQRQRAFRERRLEAEQQKLEEQEREAARKAQAAEARRLRALQKEQQQNPSADGSSTHLDAASSATASVTA